jgi:hypothetical protein
MFQAAVAMKPSLFTVRCLVVSGLAIILAGWGNLFAQMPGPGQANNLTAMMVKLFDTNTAFSAKVEFHVLDKDQKENHVMPVQYAFSDGLARMDIDMNQVKSPEIPPAQMPALRQLGMDQTVVITRPDKQLILSIYPKAKAYAQIEMGKDELAALKNDYKIVKEPQGKETVEGHVCEKSKVTFTGEKGEKSEATVWNAADLKNFPIQMQMADPDATVIVKFKDVKLVRPDAKQFEAPAGLAKYDSAEALQEVLTKPPVAPSVKK